jgi:alkylation response protein AidB-like acyl-CoA dehydrogenase
MGFEVSNKAKEINERLEGFMEEHIYPRERDYDEFTSNQENLWQYPDWYEDLKKEAKKQELWNLFLPKGICSMESWPNESRNCRPFRNNVKVCMGATNLQL